MPREEGICRGPARLAREFVSEVFADLRDNGRRADVLGDHDDHEQAAVGDIDVTVDLYYTKGTKPAKDAKPIGTFSFTISSGGSATYSENLPDPGVPGGNCITKVQSIWMSGL